MKKAEPAPSPTSRSRAASYYLNTTFNLAAEHLSGVFCLPGVSLRAQFTAISPVAVNDIVSFDGGESTITLDNGVRNSKTGEQQHNYAKMKWNFGDGTAEVTGYAPGSPPAKRPGCPCAESVFHAYTSGGTYNVTLTVTDVGGNTSHRHPEVTVVGPPPEEAAQPPAPWRLGRRKRAERRQRRRHQQRHRRRHHGAVPPSRPGRHGAVVSHSLKAALSKGVAVRYQVNEQVAGHFEVLLVRKLAKRLKIPARSRGTCPPASEPQVVIGTALVVTLKGGRAPLTSCCPRTPPSALSHVKKLC